jgi:hypothetical protein
LPDRTKCIPEIVMKRLIWLSARKLATEDGGTGTKFELMIVVTQCEPPQLSADQINSPDLCDFVNRLNHFLQLLSASFMLARRVCRLHDTIIRLRYMERLFMVLLRSNKKSAIKVTVLNLLRYLRCLQKVPEHRIPLHNILDHPTFSEKFSEGDVRNWFESQRE